MAEEKARPTAKELATSTGVDEATVGDIQKVVEALLEDRLAELEERYRTTGAFNPNVPRRREA